MEKTPQAKRGGIHNLKHYPMKYFCYSEFFKSDVAEKHQVKNIPDDAQLSQVLGNIKALVLNVLDPLRDMVGRPVIITSGYRSRRVNELVGGSKTSQHLTGKAADFHVQGCTPQQMYVVYQTMQIGFDFDQLIFYPSKNIIHVSWNENKNRQESWVKA
jgi:zinc D-Ala-D-Ala carboxypeptidase